jgi:hypothetical protein
MPLLRAHLTRTAAFNRAIRHPCHAAIRMPVEPGRYASEPLYRPELRDAADLFFARAELLVSAGRAEVGVRVEVDGARYVAVYRAGCTSFTPDDRRCAAASPPATVAAVMALFPPGTLRIPPGRRSGNLLDGRAREIIDMARRR